MATLAAPIDETEQPVSRMPAATPSNAAADGAMKAKVAGARVANGSAAGRRPYALVFWTHRHPWRGAPFDPADPGALERGERALLDGGVYAECSWDFYLEPQGARCTRLLIRTRAVSSPRWLRLLPYGLIDAYLSYAELGMIKRLVEVGSKSAGATTVDSHPRPPTLEEPKAPSVAMASDPIAVMRPEEAIP